MKLVELNLFVWMLYFSWDHYIGGGDGMKFVVETDHKPSEVINGSRSGPCVRIVRWVLRLQPYDFSVIHRPGRENIADPFIITTCS